MVFIGRNIRESWVRGLIDLLDAEVAAENARRTLMTEHFPVTGKG